MAVRAKLILLVLLPWLHACVYGYYRPSVGDRFQWQLQVDDDNPFDYSMTADLYDVDLWAVTTSQISHIHAKGGYVICYFSAGSYDHNRPDASRFPDSAIGHKMQGWDEKWIDIRRTEVKQIMADRMDLAHSKGCDGVEPDNVDGHEDDNHTGFSFGYSDQLTYNKWLAHEAHSRDLSIGLKNDAEQVSDLHQYFDWALNEECHDTSECNDYRPFLTDGKPVFNVEYVDSESVSSHDLQKCHSHTPTGMSVQFRLWDVTAWAHYC